jgi:hypothetical protein
MNGVLVVPRSLARSDAPCRWLVGLRASAELAVVVAAVPTELRELADVWTARLRALDSLRDLLGADVAVRLEVVAAAVPPADYFLADDDATPVSAAALVWFHDGDLRPGGSFYASPDPALANAPLSVLARALAAVPLLRAAAAGFPSPPSVAVRPLGAAAALAAVPGVRTAAAAALSIRPVLARIAPWSMVAREAVLLSDDLATIASARPRAVPSSNIDTSPSSATRKGSTPTCIAVVAATVPNWTNRGEAAWRDAAVARAVARRVADWIMGVVLALLLAAFVAPLTDALVRLLASDAVDMVAAPVAWVRTNRPAGIKLNAELNAAMGDAYLFYHGLWLASVRAAVATAPAAGVLAVAAAGMVGGFGLMVAAAHDLAALALLGVAALWLASSRIVWMHFRLLKRTWRVFRGAPPSWRPTERLAEERMIMGTFALAVLLLMFPTTAMYCAVFAAHYAALRLASAALDVLRHLARAIDIAPWILPVAAPRPLRLRLALDGSTAELFPDG